MLIRQTHIKHISTHKTSYIYIYTYPTLADGGLWLGSPMLGDPQAPRTGPRAWGLLAGPRSGWEPPDHGLGGPRESRTDGRLDDRTVGQTVARPVGRKYIYICFLYIDMLSKLYKYILLLNVLLCNNSIVLYCVMY